MSVAIAQDDWTEIQQCWRKLSKTLPKSNDTDAYITTMNKLLLLNDATTDVSIETKMIENITSQEFDTLMNQIENENSDDFKDTASDSLSQDEKEFISNPVCRWGYLRKILVTQ